MVTSSEKVSRILENEKQKLCEKEKELKSFTNETLFQLDQRRDTLIDLINSVIENMKHDTLQLKSSELLKIHDAIKTLESGASKFKDVAKETQASSENTSFMELIKEHTSLRSQYKDLMKVISTVLSEELTFSHHEVKPLERYAAEKYANKLVMPLDSRSVVVDFQKSKSVVDKFLGIAETAQTNAEISLAVAPQEALQVEASSLRRSSSVTVPGEVNQIIKDQGWHIGLPISVKPIYQHFFKYRLSVKVGTDKISVIGTNKI